MKNKLDRRKGYWKSPRVVAELTLLLSNPQVATRTICAKYGISRARLYQVIEQLGLPTRREFQLLQ